MWVDLKKLVSFIAGVIHAPMETKSKMDRIQIIVKAAENHVNINELTCEEVRNDLYPGRGLCARNMVETKC